MAALEEVKCEQFEVAVKQPVANVWKATMEQAHLSLAAALPEHVENVEIVQGAAGQPGSIYLIKLASRSVLAQHGFTWAKVRFDLIEHTNHTCKMTLVGGGALGILWHSLSHTIKVMPDIIHPHDHSLVKHTLEFQRIGAHEFHLTYKNTIIHATSSLEDFINTRPNYGCLVTN